MPQTIVDSRSFTESNGCDAVAPNCVSFGLKDESPPKSSQFSFDNFFGKRHFGKEVTLPDCGREVVNDNNCDPHLHLSVLANDKPICNQEEKTHCDLDCNLADLLNSTGSISSGENDLMFNKTPAKKLSPEVKSQENSNLSDILLSLSFHDELTRGKTLNDNAVTDKYSDLNIKAETSPPSSSSLSDLLTNISLLDGEKDESTSLGDCLLNSNKCSNDSMYPNLTEIYHKLPKCNTADTVKKRKNGFVKEENLSDILSLISIEVSTVSKNKNALLPLEQTLLLEDSPTLQGFLVKDNKQKEHSNENQTKKNLSDLLSEISVDGYNTLKSTKATSSPLEPYPFLGDSLSFQQVLEKDKVLNYFNDNCSTDENIVKSNDHVPGELKNNLSVILNGNKELFFKDPQSENPFSKKICDENFLKNSSKSPNSMDCQSSKDDKNKLIEGIDLTTCLKASLNTPAPEQFLNYSLNGKALNNTKLDNFTDLDEVHIQENSVCNTPLDFVPLKGHRVNQNQSLFSKCLACKPKKNSINLQKVISIKQTLLENLFYPEMSSALPAKTVDVIATEDPVLHYGGRSNFY